VRYSVPDFGNTAAGCTQTELAIRADGTVDCELVEATRDEPASNVCPPCEGARGDVSPDLRESIEVDPIYVQNRFGCMCALRQTPPGPELRACVSEPTVSGIEGWCYVDPGQREDHNAQLVADCPAGSRRTIRIVGNLPAPDALTFLRCRGGSY
jgi:hypothetical protein